jgi:hypothetical protein
MARRLVACMGHLVQLNFRFETWLISLISPSYLKLQSANHNLGIIAYEAVNELEESCELDLLRTSAALRIS